MSPVHTMNESPTCGINSAPVGICTTVVSLISNWDGLRVHVPLCNSQDLVYPLVNNEWWKSAQREGIDEILVTVSEVALFAY
jgi:hypothetical protein